MDKHIKIEIKVKIFRENGAYIAFSPELQISTQGESVDHVKQRFEERLSIFIERALETDTLRKRLEKLGWSFSEEQPLPPEEVTIPKELLNAEECENIELEKEIVA
jgi:predicted RNase H-like HicB family nuclease